MYTTQPPKAPKVVTVETWKVARGHLQMPKAGRHKDKRRQSRVNSKVSFRGYYSG